MSEKQLSRKERERLRHKKEILDTALRLFSEKGFHNVAMQEIAKASEFSVGTLYNFFESKEALFAELINNCGENITTALANILDSPGTEAERLTNFILLAPTLLEKNAEFVKLYVSELGMHGAKYTKKFDKDNHDAILNTKLEQLIKDGVRKGFFRQVDPVITTKAINSTIESVAFEVAGQFDKTVAMDIFANVKQLFIDGLLLPEGK
jgi:AcrR family transcriptional regulator